MRKPGLYIVICLLLSACGEAVMERPVWVDERDTVAGDLLHFDFETKEKDIKAVLYSPVQPLSMVVTPTSDGIHVEAKETKNVIEGQAELLLFQGENFFSYGFVLNNRKSGEMLSREFRSPKTVNPDSSLAQQRLVYYFDEGRNLHPSPHQSSFFEEEMLELTHVAGVYEAIKGDPLSAYYVQAGSCAEIPIRSSYVEEDQSHHVEAGPLNDQFGNQVSDGTIVVFYFTFDGFVGRSEGVVRNGKTQIIIPDQMASKGFVWAEMGHIMSEKIKLTH